MAQDFVAVDEPADIWHIGGHIAAATITPLMSVTIPWTAGSPDTLPRGTPLTGRVTGATHFDLTAFTWVIVAVQGLGVYVIPEKDVATLDADLGPSDTWVALRRWRGTRTSDWQQI